MLQILGICRFAFPGLGGFQVDHKTVAEREAYLYAPARMDARLRSLEHVCLRSLQIQTDQDFRFLIVTGDSLPQPIRNRLEAIVAKVPQAKIIYHPAKNHREALGEIINAHIDPDGPPVMQFRQDDDDGVARSFIARSRSTFQQVRPLWESHRRLCLDFNRGYFVRLGRTIEAAKVLRHQLGVAQAIFLEPTNTRTAFHFTHHRIPTLMPSLTITDRPMWLRGVDGTNDSPIAMGKDKMVPLDADSEADLKQRFGIRPAAIRQSF